MSEATKRAWNRGRSKYPMLAGFTGKEYGRAYDRMLAMEAERRNVTIRGGERQRVRMQRYDDLRGLPRKEYNRIRALRLKASKRVLLSDFLERLARAMARVFVFLPPECCHEFLALGKQMTVLRRRHGNKKVYVR